MKYTRPFLLLPVLGLLLLMQNCSTVRKGSHEKIPNIEELSCRAIYSYVLYHHSAIYPEYKRGLPKIDPNICVRDTLNVEGVPIFDLVMSCHLLKYPIEKISFQLTIHDSLRKKLEFISPNVNYERAVDEIFMFSPLLPSKEPNIYLMQTYIWKNASMGPVTPPVTPMQYSIWKNASMGEKCWRYLEREYIRFRIDGQKIEFMDRYSSDNSAYDFYGGRLFPIKMLEEKKE